MKSPICLALNGVANIILFSMGAFILPNGWFLIDSIDQRDQVYILFFLVLPITIPLFIFHLVGFFLPARSIAPSIFCGLLFGFLGPLYLDYSIRTSGQDVAVMAYIGLFMYYGVFAVAGFVLCAIVLGVRNLFLRRHGEHRVQHTQ